MLNLRKTISVFFLCLHYSLSENRGFSNLELTVISFNNQKNESESLAMSGYTFLKNIFALDYLTREL